MSAIISANHNFESKQVFQVLRAFKMRLKSLCWLLAAFLTLSCAEAQILEGAAIAEVTEIISVVRIGVSLVKYIYKGTMFF